jgi:hypothetical protein
MVYLNWPFVAQTLTANKLLVYIYAEKGVNPLILLDDFKIPVEATMENDENFSSSVLCPRCVPGNFLNAKTRY